jgi:hypothetical protein
MTDYLAKYGNPRMRRFQEGGEMPAAEPMPAEGGAPQGGGGEEEVLALAQAAAGGDMEAAAQLGMMLAPMILEQAGAAQGGAPAGPEAGMAPEGGAPMQRKGGVMLYRTGGTFTKPVFRRKR